MAALVDDTLPRAERARAHAHLADCAACRAELVAVRRLVPGRSKLRLYLPLGAAAAIATVALGIALVRPDGATPELRGVAARTVEITAPADSAAVGVDGAFAWLPVPAALEYRVTVTTPSGDIVTERVTADPTLAVPAMPAGPYQWFVSASLEDGTTLTSPVRTFRIP